MDTGGDSCAYFKDKEIEITAVLVNVTWIQSSLKKYNIMFSHFLGLYRNDGCIYKSSSGTNWQRNLAFSEYKNVFLIRIANA